MPKNRISRVLAAVVIVVAAAFLAQTLANGVPLSRLRPSQTSPASPETALETFLAKAAEYCRKLESSAFDLVCREEISEAIDPSLDAAADTRTSTPVNTKFSGPAISFSKVKKINHRFVNDYRCVRSGRTIHETRIQLEKNGKKKVVPDVPLQTSVVVFGTALLGPVGLFGERFQPDYEYTIAGEAKIGKVKVLIIDAKPKPGAPASRNPYGKAWIDPATGDILKIEWNESRVGRYDIFEKRGEIFKRKPRLIIRSEFNAEKNGVRFPSFFSVEEAYIGDGKPPFVRSKTEVAYKDFKFFTVDYDYR